MRHRNSVALLVLFLAGICVLWWADYTDVPTREKQRELLNRILPELIDTPTAEIRRIEVDRRSGVSKDRIVVERREGGAWQLLEPVDTAADPGLIETLAGNLKDLRKSAAAGTIHGDPAPYGLTTPQASVKVYVKNSKEPAATLDLGDAPTGRVYVRPGAGSGIEVVDPRTLSALSLPASKWRDPALFHVPSFRVRAVTVRGPDPAAEISLERDDRRWRLVKPFKVPADNDKAEGLVAELSALRVTEGESAFVADDVRGDDLSQYGLDTPSTTVTVTPFGNSAKPQTLRLGKAVPGKPDEVYAMRGDQDDVVRLDVKRLREAAPGANGLRSQTVLDLNPSRVDRVRFETRGAVYDLLKTPSGWNLLGSHAEPADDARVQTLLVKLSELKSSEFLDPSRVNDPRLDKPAFRIRGWRAVPGETPSVLDPKAEPKAEPGFDLSLGRRDAYKKSVYGRVAGDSTILALPDSILDDLPGDALAFHDRTILSLQPPDFASVTVEQGRSVVKVESPPATGAKGMHWTLVEPVAAPADESAITALLLTLGHLRAESWESERVGDGKEYGLDAPAIRVKWTAQPGTDSFRTAPPVANAGSLRIGKVKPGGRSSYANVEGDPKVFLLNPGVVEQFQAELHSKKVINFKAADAERVVFRWPNRTVSLERKARRPGLARVWEVSPGYDTAGVDVSRIDAIVDNLSDLKTPRFLQYSGPIPEVSELASPRVTVQVTLAGKAAGFTLRVGKGVNPSTFVATNVPGDDGPVFVIAADACKDFLNPPIRPGEIPDDVFAPEAGPSRPPG